MSRPASYMACFRVLQFSFVAIGERMICSTLIRKIALAPSGTRAARSANCALANCSTSKYQCGGKTEAQLRLRIR